MERVIAGTGDQNIIALSTIERVISGATIEQIIQVVPNDLVCTRSTNSIFDVAGIRNGDVIGHAVA